MAVNGKIYVFEFWKIVHPVAGGANGLATAARIAIADIARAAHCEHIVAVRREERFPQNCTLSPRYHQLGDGGNHSPDLGIAPSGSVWAAVTSALSPEG